MILLLCDLTLRELNCVRLMDFSLAVGSLLSFSLRLGSDLNPVADHVAVNEAIGREKVWLAAPFRIS